MSVLVYGTCLSRVFWRRAFVFERRLLNSFDEQNVAFGEARRFQKERVAFSWSVFAFQRGLLNGFCANAVAFLKKARRFQNEHMFAFVIERVAFQRGLLNSFLCEKRACCLKQHAAWWTFLLLEKSDATLISSDLSPKKSGAVLEGDIGAQRSLRSVLPFCERVLLSIFVFFVRTQLVAFKKHPASRSKQEPQRWRRRW